MKTNFKKTLAVFLAVLMLTSAFSVTAFAATYTVTYMPGEGVEGEVYVDEFTSSIKIRRATYTREHFTQTGWSTTEGGKNTNSFNSTYRTKKNIVLYPVWKGDTYTITYDPGMYATSGSIVTDSANYGEGKALKGAIFSRDGYVHAGWSLTDGGAKVYEVGSMSDAITGNLTLYPYWAKICKVTYVPGEYGVGASVEDSVESGIEFTVKNKLFTREGYRQEGWSLTDGGEKVYNLLQGFVTINEDIVLYPYWVENIYGIEVSANELYFGEVCEDYTTPAAQSISITNTGNIDTTLTAVLPANYTISVNGSLVLAAGETRVFAIQPGSALGIGDYVEQIVISTAEKNTIVETVDLQFYVSEHVYDEFKSNNDATYTADGTKTSTCVKNCGKETTIVDVGSKKVYSINNNTAAGLASSYEYHRTVRFTAFGSGMDANTNTEVGKRFRPVSWYVDDEFNGEFTGNQFENGYDVTFTHTIFGNYTLIINYVEEEYDATTGEWIATGETDTKTFEYTVGTTAEEEQEIVRPNTILNIIFGLFAELLKLLGLGG